MNAAERMDLLERIGLELQRRYTFSELDIYFKATRIKTLSPSDRADSKRAYAKERLAGVADIDLLKVASELNLIDGETEDVKNSINLPELWRDNDKFRLFLSHVAKNKQKAHRLKEELAGYGIVAFVAHDDIEPTIRWAEEIISALHTMEAFAAVLTDGFKGSAWCNQEAGFAIGKGIKMISFKMESEDPPGFMGAEQALTWQTGQRADDVAEQIVRILWKDERTNGRLLEAFDSLTRIPQRPMDVMTELADRWHLRAQ